MNSDAPLVLARRVERRNPVQAAGFFNFRASVCYRAIGSKPPTPTMGVGGLFMSRDARKGVT
jgi:hypothetical protein